MKTLRAFFCCVIFLCSCQPKESSVQRVDSLQVDTLASNKQSEDVAVQNSTVQQSPSEPVKSTFTLSSIEFDALVQPGATIYSDTIEGAEMITEKQNLEPVYIISNTGLRYPEGEDQCYQHPWYQVKFSDQSTGWVSGDYILIAKRDDSAYVGQFEYNEKSYGVHYAFDTGIGPSDTYGLTGCNEYHIPYLLDAENRTLRFIEHTNAVGINGITDAYRNWFSILLSEGGSAKIASIESDKAEVRFNLDIFYQDGGEKAIIRIVEKDGDFIADSGEIIGKIN